MRHLFLVLCAALSLYTTQAQQIVELDKQFSAIELIGPLRAQLIPAEQCRTVITLYNIDAQRLKWRQKDSTLTVSLTTGVVEKNSYAELKIYYKNISSIKSQGAEISCTDTLISPTLNIEATSSINKMDIVIKSDELIVEASGDCNIKLSGSSVWGRLRALLGSKITAGNLLIDNCTATANQGAEIVVRVKEHLDAKAGSKASIYYFGEPLITIRETLGAGVVPVIEPTKITRQ